MLLSTPRLVIAGLAGDSGKTLLAVGLARALASTGVQVAPFKKGPDYIDAAWLGAAAGRPGRNLDSFLMGPERLEEALARGGRSELVLIEGNRGLFDGLDARGTHSTAELAKRLQAPVVLVVDVTKSTRTVAALILGCQALDGALDLAGVVLNRVSTPRQERVIREAIADSGGPPVLGALPRLESAPFPGRHLGLLTAAEHPEGEAALAVAAGLVRQHLDLPALLRIAASAPPIEIAGRPQPAAGPPVRVAVFRDQAFSFYYPDNLEALEEGGAQLCFVSPLAGDPLPEADALYIGGGFPEAYADRLAQNCTLRQALHSAAAAGLPIYAECGGLMYLARELTVGGVAYPMAGLLDLRVEQTPRPVGHGYVTARVEVDNPFFEPGATLRGHEFHYSRVIAGVASQPVLRLERGSGLGEGRDGVVSGRVWASYLHLHALGTPEWAPSLLALARVHQRERRDRHAVSPASTDWRLREGVRGSAHADGR